MSLSCLLAEDNNMFYLLPTDAQHFTNYFEYRAKLALDIENLRIDRNVRHNDMHNPQKCIILTN